MTPTLARARRALPWIASLAVHGLLLALVPLSADLRLAREPVVERRGVLQFDDQEPAVDRAAEAAPTVGAAALQPPKLPAVPTAAPARGYAAPPSSSSARIATTAIGAPAPGDVLATLPAVTTATAAAAAAESTIRVAWTGKARGDPVKSPRPKFPRVLSTTGQEARGEARITVSPLGAVIDVEITRSSGYTEIDESVSTALWQWLFPRIEGRQNQIGTISFSFPLEKRD
jgi:TonB family protein